VLGRRYLVWPSEAHFILGIKTKTKISLKAEVRAPPTHPPQGSALSLHSSPSKPRYTHSPHPPNPPQGVHCASTQIRGTCTPSPGVGEWGRGGVQAPHSLTQGKE